MKTGCEGVDPLDSLGWEVREQEAAADYGAFRVVHQRMASRNGGDVREAYCLAAADWVNIVALTVDRKVVLVNQYRCGSNSITLEFPGGLIDADETPETAARRELLEETGFLAESVELIGSVNPNPAHFSNRLFTFLASDVVLTGAAMSSLHETTVVELVDEEDLPGLIAEGRIDHALMLAGFQWYQLYRGRKGSGRARKHKRTGRT